MFKCQQLKQSKGETCSKNTATSKKKKKQRGFSVQ